MSDLSLRAMMRSWWIVAVCLVLSLGVMGVYLAASERVYESTSTQVIGPSPSLTSTDDVVRSFESLQNPGIVPTLVELFHSRSVADRAAAAVSIDTDLLSDYTITAAVLSGSTTMELTVSGPDAEITTVLNEAIAAQATSQFSSLYPIYAVTTLDPPTIPTTSTSPQPLRSLAVAAVLGLLIGLGLAAGRTRLRDDVMRRRPLTDADPVATAGTRA